MTKDFIVKPVPSDLDLGAMYSKWEENWLANNKSLPTNKDLDKESWVDYVTPEWLEFLKPYIHSNKPADKYFAEYVMCWYAVN